MAINYSIFNHSSISTRSRSPPRSHLQTHKPHSRPRKSSTYILVAAGDSLKSLAQKAYANTSLWYVLAAANALSGDSDLVAGTSLKVPDTGVAKNDSSTFKPYNPNEIVGSTSPGLPYVPPASGCGAVGMIIMVVIAIVVTVYTAGAAATFFAGSSSVLGAMGASTMATGLAALSGGGLIAGTGISLATGAAIAGAAVGGFVGAVVSQAAGSLMGVANFSWRKAVGSGIASGLTAGIAGAMGGSLSTLMQNSQFGRVAASAALGSMASYAGNEIAGVKNNSFSWKSIAASAVTALVTSKITSKLGEKLNLDYATESGQLTSDLIGNMTGGVVGLHTRRAFGFDDRVDYGMIAADAFGNLIGNSITGKYKYDAVNFAEKINEQTTKENTELQVSINNLSPVGQTVFSEQIEAGADVQEALATAIEQSSVQSNPVDPQWQLNMPSAAVVYDDGVGISETKFSGDDGGFGYSAENGGNTGLGASDNIFDDMATTLASRLNPTYLSRPYGGAFNNFEDAAEELRRYLGASDSQSIEEFSRNFAIPNQPTMSAERTYDFREGKVYPDTPNGSRLIGTIYVSKSFSQSLLSELGLGLFTSNPDDIETAPAIIEPKKRDIVYAKSAKDQKHLDSIQERQIARFSRDQNLRASTISTAAEGFEVGRQLLVTAGVAYKKSKYLNQIDLYEDIKTGERKFEVTGFTFKFDKAQVLINTPSPVYTNNLNYKAIIKPVVRK